MLSSIFVHSVDKKWRGCYNKDIKDLYYKGNDYVIFE